VFKLKGALVRCASYLGRIIVFVVASYIELCLKRLHKFTLVALKDICNHLSKDIRAFFKSKVPYYSSNCVNKIEIQHFEFIQMSIFHNCFKLQKYGVL